MDAQEMRYTSGKAAIAANSKIVHKSHEAFVKADESGKTGEFEAVVSVFGNVDSDGDRVQIGAYEKSLASYTAQDRVMNVVWSHKIGDPMLYIGAVEIGKELTPGDRRLPEKIRSNGGLYIAGVFDDHPDDREAQKVYRLMKGRRINEFSFTYGLEKYSIVEEQGKKIVDFEEVDIWEVGPTLRGANDSTQLIDIKSASASATGLNPAVSVEASVEASHAKARANQLRLMRMKLQLES